MATAKTKAKVSPAKKTVKKSPLIVSASAESHSMIIQFAIVFIILAALGMAFYLGKMMGIGQ